MKTAEKFAEELIEKYTSGAYIICSEAAVCATCQKETWRRYKYEDCFECMRLRIVTEAIEADRAEIHAMYAPVVEVADWLMNSHFRQAQEARDLFKLSMFKLDSDLDAIRETLAAIKEVKGDA